MMDRLQEAQKIKDIMRASQPAPVFQPASTESSVWSSIFGLFSTETEPPNVVKAELKAELSPGENALHRYLILTSNLHQVLNNLTAEVDLCPNAARVICTDWSLYPNSDEKRDACESYLKGVRQKLTDCRRLIDRFRLNQLLAGTCYAFVDTAQQNYLTHRIVELEQRFISHRDEFWRWYESQWQPAVRAVQESSNLSKSHKRK